SQVCEFVAEKYGFDAILEMLRRYREKEKTPQILQQALKLSEPTYDRQFNEYIRGKVGPYLGALETLGKNEGLGKMTKEALLARLAAQPNDFALNLRAGSLYQAEGDE